MIACVLALGLTVTAVWAADLSGIKCPVSNKPVNADATADYRGGQVYFCCTNCPKGFAKNTAKFASKANLQLALTGQAAQKGCPISGKKLNDDTALDVAGVSVKFCCNNCRGKVAGAEGDAQRDLVFSDKAFDKAFKVSAASEE